MTDTPGFHQGHMPPSVTVGCPPEDYHRWSDIRLLQECRDGDDQAWDILLERYGSYIFSVALKFDLPDEDVAFVFQTVFLEVLTLGDILMDQADLGSWLLSETLWLCRQFAEAETRLQDENDALDDSACANSRIERTQGVPVF